MLTFRYEIRYSTYIFGIKAHRQQPSNKEYVSIADSQTLYRFFTFHPYSIQTSSEKEGFRTSLN
jgi:hypothetical protein